MKGHNSKNNCVEEYRIEKVIERRKRKPWKEKTNEKREEWKILERKETDIFRLTKIEA